MLFVANDLHDVNELKILLVKEFDMKVLGVAKKVLGTKIHRHKSTYKSFHIPGMLVV